MEKIIILAFEGIDKTGKTTLIDRINKRTDYLYLCIDRFTGSAWVYDKLFNRRERSDKLRRVEEELSSLSSVLILNIILKCEQEELEGRISRCKDDRDNKEFLKKAKKIYEKYEKDITCFPTIKVDTTDKSIEETVEEILNKVRRYE